MDNGGSSGSGGGDGGGSGGGTAGSSGHARGPARPEFRSGNPMRLSGWLGVGLPPRRTSRFVRLDGEVLSVHADADDEATTRTTLLAIDLRRATVERPPARARARRDFRVVVGARATVFRCNTHEELCTWAATVQRAATRAFDASYVLGQHIRDGSSAKVFYAHPKHADAHPSTTTAATTTRSTRSSSSSSSSSSPPPAGWPAPDSGAAAPSPMAVKVIKLRPNDAQGSEWARRERYIAAALPPHNNIVQTVDIFAAVDRVHIVMELMRGGTLQDLLDRHPILPELHARVVMRDVFAALTLLHANNIVHRDVRPDNVFCSEPRFPMALALGDFGAANFIPDHRVHREVLSSMAGHISYMAAEVVQRQKYGPQADLWSAGVLMYRILSGSLPFRGETTRHVFDAIRSGSISFHEPAWSTTSNEAKSLVRQLLQPDPHKRISAVAASHHHWLTAPAGGSPPPVLQSNLPIRSPTLRVSQPSSVSSSSNCSGQGYHVPSTDRRLARAGDYRGFAPSLSDHCSPHPSTTPSSIGPSFGSPETRSVMPPACSSASDDSSPPPQKDSRRLFPVERSGDNTNRKISATGSVSSPLSSYSTVSDVEDAVDDIFDVVNVDDEQALGQTEREAASVLRSDSPKSASIAPSPQAPGLVRTGGSGVVSSMIRNFEKYGRSVSVSAGESVQMSMPRYATPGEDMSRVAKNSTHRGGGSGALLSPRQGARNMAGAASVNHRRGLDMLPMMPRLMSTGGIDETQGPRCAPFVSYQEGACTDRERYGTTDSLSLLGRNMSRNSVSARNMAGSCSQRLVNGSTNALRPVSSTSSMPGMIRSTSSKQSLMSQGGHPQGRMVITPSLRKICEDGLQEAIRQDPVRIKQLMKSKVMQQQLNVMFPYRRKLVITARAFIAIFRLLALVKGHSLTRHLSVMEDGTKAGTRARANEIAHRRKEAMESVSDLAQLRSRDEPAVTGRRPGHLRQPSRDGSTRKLFRRGGRR